eukprot:586453-Pleurochrysis_carterae.AAC.1
MAGGAGGRTRGAARAAGRQPRTRHAGARATDTARARANWPSGRATSPHTPSRARVRRAVPTPARASRADARALHTPPRAQW